MSSNLLGGLGVELYADLARLRQDMAEARKTVDSGAVAMRAAADMAAKALGALGLGLSTAALVNWVRGAIDAADETFNLSQKVGIASKDLAGIQLAFKQADVESGGMQTALVKLAKNVAEGDDVFKRMGLSVRNTDGSLKSSKQVLYEVSDVFAGMPDGISKTALATEVFGKAGADLLPMLEGGSDGLREMADMAAKLGLVIDDETAAAADQFNDTVELLGMTSQGVGRQVAAQLLPTLNSLAGSLLDNVVSGDKLAKVSDILGAGLKGLFSIGALGVEVFNTLGKVVGGVVGALVAVVSGEYRQAARILEESGRDIVQGWGGTAKTIADVWSGAGAKTVEQASAMGKALRGTTVATKEQADAAKKQREEQEKLVKAGQDYLRGVDAQFAALQQEIALGRALTDAEKELLKLEQQLAQGKLVLTAAERASAEAKLREMDAVRQQRAAQEELLKTMAAVAAHASKLDAARASETEKLREAVVAQREQNETLGLSAREIAERTARSYEASAAEKEWQAAIEGGNWQLEEQARLLRDRAQLTRDGVVLQEAKAAADEWKKVSDQIGQGLTDSLFRAFESGKGFFKTLWDGIRNTFKTTVLRLAVDMVMNPVKSAIGGLLGPVLGGAAGSAGASPLGGAGSLMDGGKLLGMLGGLQSFGSGLGAGFGALFGEAGLAGAVDAGLTALGAGNIGGGLGTLAGSLGPYALGAMAIYTLAKKLDKSGTPHTGSVVAANASGLSTVMGDASQITNNLSSDVDAALRAASAGSTGTLNALAGAFGLQGGYQSLAKFASDATDPSIGQFSLWNQAGTLGRVGTESQFAFYDADPQRAYGAFVGDVTRITRDALAGMGLPDWALAEVNKLGAGATLDDVAALAAQLIQAKKDRDAPAAATGDTADSWARSTMQYDSRSVDLLQSANDRLQAVSDAAARGAAAGEAHLAASQAGFTQLIERVERLAAALDDMARPARLAALAEG